jgi:hypothetical protein
MFIKDIRIRRILPIDAQEFIGCQAVSFFNYLHLKEQIKRNTKKCLKNEQAIVNWNRLCNLTIGKILQHMMLLRIF